MVRKLALFLLMIVLIVGSLWGGIVYSKPLVDKPVTLTFMRADSEVPPHSLTKEIPLVWQWWEEATGITVKPVDVVLQQDYKQIFQLKAAAGQINADIIQMEGDNQGTYIAQYVRDGLILPLNDLIDKYAPNIKALLKKYPEYKKALTLPDGKIYCIGDMNVSRYQFMGFLIRKDWLDKLGLKMPNTLDDWYKTAIAFAKNDPNGNGRADEVGMMSSDGLWGLNNFGVAWDLRLCTGAGWHLREGKIGYDFIRPEAKELLKFLNKCVKDGAFPPDYNDPNLGFGSVKSRVVNGQLGIWVRMSPVLAGYLNDPEGDLKKADPKARWTAALPPLTPDGKRINVLEDIAYRGRTYAITRKCKDPVAAIKWLDFVFASKEGREIAGYGKEGVTYKRNPDGSIERLVKFNSQDEIISGPLAGKWWGGGVTMPTITDDTAHITQLKTWKTPQWVMNDIKANLKYTVRSLQIPILSPEEANEVNKLVTDITTYKDEMWAKFVAGDIPITDENFNKYVETIKNLGLDRVLQIYQSAWDRSK